MLAASLSSASLARPRVTAQTRNKVRLVSSSSSSSSFLRSRFCVEGLSLVVVFSRPQSRRLDKKSALKTSSRERHRHHHHHHSMFARTKRRGSSKWSARERRKKKRVVSAKWTPSSSSSSFDNIIALWWVRRLFCWLDFSGALFFPHKKKESEKERRLLLLTKIMCVFVSSFQSRRRVLFFDPRKSHSKKRSHRDDASKSSPWPNQKRGRDRPRMCSRRTRTLPSMANFGCVKAAGTSTTARKARGRKTKGVRRAANEDSHWNRGMRWRLQLVAWLLAFCWSARCF